MTLFAAGQSFKRAAQASPATPPQPGLPRTTNSPSVSGVFTAERITVRPGHVPSGSATTAHRRQTLPATGLSARVG
jgi:hypothetical protein